MRSGRGLQVEQGHVTIEAPRSGLECRACMAAMNALSSLCRSGSSSARARTLAPTLRSPSSSSSSSDARGPRQDDSAVGHDARLHDGPGRVQRIVDPVLALLDLHLAGRTHLDDGDAAGELGEPFLEVLLLEQDTALRVARAIGATGGRRLRHGRGRSNRRTKVAEPETAWRIGAPSGAAAVVSADLASSTACRRGRATGRARSRRRTCPPGRPR